MPSRKDHRYEINDKVLCKHGAFFYEAKIIDVEEDDGELVYLVHYQGWHKRYDERIPQSNCPHMFLPLTEANIAKAKADIQEASAAKKKRKKQNLEDDDARKSENGSRASTPSDRAGSSCHAPSVHSDRRGPVSRLPESVIQKVVDDADARPCCRQMPPRLTQCYAADFVETLRKSKKHLSAARSRVWEAENNQTFFYIQLMQKELPASTCRRIVDSFNKPTCHGRTDGTGGSLTASEAHPSFTLSDNPKPSLNELYNRTASVSLGPEIDAQVEILCNLPMNLKRIIVDEHHAVMVQGKLPILPARVNVYNIVEQYVEFVKSEFTQGPIDIEHAGGVTKITGRDSLIETARNLRDIFDVVLGYQLLYKFEKPQYQALAKREHEMLDENMSRTQDAAPSRKSRRSVRDVRPAFPASVIVQLRDDGPLRAELLRPSKYYGLGHLLRLLVKLPVLLRLSTWVDNDEFMVRIACMHDFFAFLRQNAQYILDIDLDYKVPSADYLKTIV